MRRVFVRCSSGHVKERYGAGRLILGAHLRWIYQMILFDWCLIVWARFSERVVWEWFSEGNCLIDTFLRAWVQVLYLITAVEPVVRLTTCWHDKRHVWCLFQLTLALALGLALTWEQEPTCRQGYTASMFQQFGAIGMVRYGTIQHGKQWHDIMWYDTGTRLCRYDLRVKSD